MKTAKKAPTIAEIADALTVYEREKINEKASEKAKKKAKATVLAWLGDRDSAKLPDGRTVSRVETPYDAATINRSAYVAVSLSIQHPLPAIAAAPRRARAVATA